MIRAIPLAVLLLVLAACDPGDGEDGPPAGSPAAGDSTIAVTLTSYELEISGEATAGEVVFELNNDADLDHAFAIRGNDIEDTLARRVEPGSVERVTVELEAGTYTVWCPIGDHRDRGMEAELEVTEAGGS